MKIAHINTEKTFRGGEKQTFYLIKGLNSKGIKNFLICNKGALIKERCLKILDNEHILEIPLRCEFDINAIFKIRRFLKKNKVDIIHCHTSHAHTLGYFASLGLNIKVVVSRRVDFSIYKGKIKFLNRIKYNYMCDKIIAISEKIKEVLINDNINPEKIEVVHSGVEIIETTYSNLKIKKEFNLKDNNIVLVNIAALESHKGQEFLIKSFKIVSEKFPNSILLIVGDGYLKDRLIDLRNKSGLRERIIFTGFREDVYDILLISDIFIMSSIEEGLCTSILDALVYNKIVVATDAGGIPEILQNGKMGILVRKGDVKSLANGLIEAIKNIDYYRDKFKNSREFVRKYFSVEKMVEGNLKVYKNLLKK